MNKKLKGNYFINFNFKIFIFLYILILLPTKILALENKILFKINNNIITTVDVLNEIKYLKLLNSNFKNLEQDKIYKIAKNSVMRDMIKEDHLKNFFKKIELDDVFVEKFILDYFSKYNFNSIENLEKFLIENNLKLAFMEKKITLQLMWNELILKKFSQNIKINKDKIEKQISKKKIQQEFLISEIIFNIKSKDELQNKFNEISEEIKNNSFSNAALIHSISDTSINGGKLGWVKESSLSNEIKNEIKKTKIGEITMPVSIPGAFIILYKEDKRETLIKLDIKKEIDKIIKKRTNEQLNQFSNIYYNKIKKNVNIYEF
ncbi:peptidylprolyl isomerase [Pelagibacterales bacterium SAG-MED10]|nr:peptidylprolyl isomerase [Pelagibacterales bacterium SAG-MED10]